MSNLGNKKTKVLLWQWGRRGSGPKYTLELARALRSRRDLEVHLSLSRQSELFEQSQSLGLASFHVDTYTGKPSAALSLLRLSALRKRFKAYLRRSQIDVVLCPMTHLWNAAIIEAVRSSNVPYVMMVHDATLHPGEVYSFQRWLLEREVRASDGIITLSNYVRQQVRNIYNYPVDRICVASPIYS